MQHAGLCGFGAAGGLPRRSCSSRGVSQSEVARLGVHRQSVIRWARQLAQLGLAGLKQAGRGWPPASQALHWARRQFAEKP
jgi:transposase